MKKMLTACLILLLLTPTASVHAGENLSLPPREGERVRVDAPEVADQRITGHLLRADEGDFMVTRDDGKVVSIPRSAIRDLQVARGRRSHAKKGAVIGAIVGTSVMFASYAADGFCDGDPACFVYAPVISGAAGMFLGVVGAGIGAAVKTDRWMSADPGRVRVTVAPTRGGAAVGVSVRF